MQKCPREADWALIEARRKYARVLACWASDALSLRRRGLDRPVYGGRTAQVLRTNSIRIEPTIDRVAT